MEYSQYTLPFLRDLYPTGTDNINTSFSIPDPRPISINQAYNYPSETLVTFRGKYPQNTINFAIQSLEQIKESTVTEANGQPLTFEFIVNFPNPDGTPDYWTSPRFKTILRNAQNSGNPYLRLEKLPIITIDFNQLSSYSKGEELTAKEGYAGVNIVQTMNTKEDMLLHINWVVSDDEALRPVVGNSKYKRFGAWEVIDDPTLIEEWAQFLETLESTEWPEFQDVIPATQTNNPDVNLSNILTNGLTTDQGTSNVNGMSIITPLGGNPLDPLNLNGTQTNDVNYNIFDAFNGNTNLALADGTTISIDVSSVGAGGAYTNPLGNTGIAGYDLQTNYSSGTDTMLPIGPIGPLNIGVGGVNTPLGNTGIGGGINPLGNTGNGMWAVNSSGFLVNSGGRQSFGELNLGGTGASTPIIGLGGGAAPTPAYLPFLVRGKSIGEVRVFNNTSYTWSGTSWIGS